MKALFLNLFTVENSKPLSPQAVLVTICPNGPWFSAKPSHMAQSNGPSAEADASGEHVQVCDI